MSDIIRLLPDSVANQIAAGEVIQRPASVVKELVENAVDAGASEISVFIKDAGRTLIQVVDNGKGMSETDARMAFERHATSKIRQAEDLFSLHTMGFRGEALPSICAIAQVELRTFTGEGNVGTRLVISGSRVETQEACVCEKGSSFSVRNLYFNVPVRRRFLKSDNVEMSNIMREFERLALVNNNIRMILDTGMRRIDLMPATMKQRIGDLWKNNLNMQLLPVDVDTSLVKIHGFVSRPEFARRRNPLQFLIVNGRNMRHPYFHKGILSCFEGLIATDTQPCYFLKFEVDPSTVDVNIHPTKNEIKFEYEQQIWPILTASVRSALGKFAAVPSIDFNSDVVPVNPLAPGETPVPPSIDVPENYNPFASVNTTDMNPVSGVASGRSAERKTGGNSGNYHTRRVSSNWEELYSGFLAGKGLNSFSDGESSREELSQLPGFGQEKDSDVGPICLQYALKYIITSTRNGLMVVDQHRAHVRILYERYLNSVRTMEHLSQRVMFPEAIALDPEHQAALSSVGEGLKRLGFVLEYEEENVWRIEGAPVMLNGADPKDVILRILDSVCEESVNYGKESGEVDDDMIRAIALLMARSAAIVKGRRLTGAEMEHIIGELFTLQEPSLTPDGKRIYVILGEDKIKSMINPG